MADRSTVYFVQGLHGYKIGITNSVRKRLSAFKTANPHIRLLSNSAFMERKKATWLERSLHVKYAHKRISGEWFDLGPAEVNEVMETLKGRRNLSNLGPKRIKLHEGTKVLLAFTALLTVTLFCASILG